MAWNFKFNLQPKIKREKPLAKPIKKATKSKQTTFKLTKSQIIKIGKKAGLTYKESSSLLSKNKGATIYKILKTNNSNLIFEYQKAIERAYNRNPNNKLLRELQKVSQYNKIAKALKETNKYIKQDLMDQARFYRDRYRGTSFTPTITKTTDSRAEYILQYHSDRLSELIKNKKLTSQEAIDRLWEELKSEKKVEELKQSSDFGFIDQENEIIIY